MNYSKMSFLQLVELSIIGVKESYNEVFERLESILKTCFWKSTQGFSYDVDYKAFVGFAWSWILEKDKIHYAYFRFLKENVGEDEFDAFLKRYYYSIARSAVFAFLKEEYPAFRHNGKLITDPETGEKKLVSTYLEIPFTEDYEEGVPFTHNSLNNKNELTVYSPERMCEEENAEELISELFDTIRIMNPKKRISFWLVHLSRCYPLHESDVELLAEMNHCSNEDIRQRIRDGVEKNMGCKYSVSSEFVAELLGEVPNTVTVRIRRLIKTFPPSIRNLMEA